MTLREKVHSSIDTLDEDSLAEVYEHVKLLANARVSRGVRPKAPSLDEVVAATSTDKSDWGAQIIADRADRL